MAPLIWKNNTNLSPGHSFFPIHLPKSKFVDRLRTYHTLRTRRSYRRAIVSKIFVATHAPINIENKNKNKQWDTHLINWFWMYIGYVSTHYVFSDTILATSWCLANNYYRSASLWSWKNKNSSPFPQSINVYIFSSYLNWDHVTRFYD